VSVGPAYMVTTSRRIFGLSGLTVLLLLLFDLPVRADVPPWSFLEQKIDLYFESLDNWQKNDLISRTYVVPLLEQLQVEGWTADDAKEITGDALADDDFLVQQLSTESGRRFMRKISSQKLIYDQLDRVARESGGKALIRHLIRLPDGEQFVQSGKPVTTPGLIELLPKKGSGKTRRIKDFDKPTKKIYTAEQLKERLQTSYEKQNSATENK